VISPPISPEANGKLRVLWGSLQADADTQAAAVATLPSAMVQAAGRRDISARRALDRVVERMPAALVHRTPRTAVWRVFTPIEQLPAGDLPDPADDSRGVMVKGYLLGVRGRTAMNLEPFGAVFTWHALGRLLDRSGFTVDPLKAMREAHDALLLVTPATGGQLLDLEDLTLPSTGGGFLCQTRRVGANQAPLAIARTWISDAQVFPHQAAHLSAWEQLLGEATTP
jgi:hypothetical protein